MNDDETTQTPQAPQPKRLVQLSQTLGARPNPPRRAEAPALHARTTVDVAAADGGPSTVASEPEHTAPRTPVTPQQVDPTERPAGASPSQPEARPSTPAAKSRTSTRRREPASRLTSSGGDPGRVRRRDQTVFYLPIDISDQLRDAARRNNQTNADIIFDAIEASMPDLPRIVEENRTTTGPSEGDGVFQRAGTRPVGRKVQVSAVVSDTNLAIIDQLAAEHGAESRSQLVEASLTAYFAASGAVPA